VTWPAWFAGADFLLVALALSLAVLVSSFVARNSDLWLHLAAGKRLLAGEYQPGTDPFSYSAANRAWVNHSLLFDAGAYLLYRGNGVLLVVVKTLAVVLTFGLLIGIRRPGFTLWPWAGVAGVAILAAAPKLSLSPLVGSMLLLAATLFLLFRFPHRPGSWRFPVAIGITFWIWAQVDSWFILGPLTLGLVLLGELIQAQLRKSEQTADATTDPEPLGVLPDMPTLVKALGIGLLACMLNPHHIRILQLPFELLELIQPKGAKADSRFQLLLISPLDKIYVDNGSLGYNLNGLAYAVLFVGGGVVLGLGVGRIRIAHIALWVGFALLTLLTVNAIPFLAIVAIPLVAAQLNVFSSRCTLKSWGDPKTKFLLLGSAAGRVMVLILIGAGCVLAWPGWMQPDSNNPAFTRRVAWGIEPDPGLVQAAQQLQTLRESGRLPPEVHGAIASVDLANYCAWFAPLEKVLLNGNYNHHRTEIPEFIAIRDSLGLLSREPPNANEVGAMLDKIGAEYLVIASTQGDSPGTRNSSRASVTGREDVEHRWMAGLWADTDHWAPWYLDGRSTISGWRSTPQAKQATFTALRFDPVVLAFGSKAERLPATSVKPIPPIEGWEGEFLHGVGMSPPGVDEAFGWLMYKGLIQRQNAITEQLASVLWGSFIPVPSELTQHRLIMQILGNRRRPPPETFTAIPFLTLRAARRAIATDPDHPDSYLALYLALADTDLPITEAERTIGQVTALRQCLFRLPPPERFRPGIYRASPFMIARSLATLYYPLRQPGLPLDLPALGILGDSSLVDGVTGVAEENRRLIPIPWRDRGRVRNVVGGPYLRALDLARETLVLAGKYAEKELSPDNKTEMDGLKSATKALEDELVKKNQDYEREKLRGGEMKIAAQVRTALKYNLVGEALRILTDKATDLPKEYGPNVFEIVLVQIALEMVTGRLEDAATDLEIAPKVLESSPMPPGIKREQALQFQAFKQAQLQGMTYQKLLFEGNYQGAGEILESSVSGQSEQDPSPSPAEAAFKLTQPLVALGRDQVLLGFQFIPVAPLAFIGRSVLLNDVMQPFLQRQQVLRAIRGNASTFFYQRGLLSLYEGDIPTAKKRFEQSRRPGVPEWGVPEQRNPNADRYLKLIEEAEKKALKP
jgi:hypothetical protein